MDALRVHPHARGPWLVRRGVRQLGVPAELGRGLQSWDGARLSPDLLSGVCRGAARAAGLDEMAGRCLAAALLSPPPRRGRGPWIRRPLLPAGAVARLARPLVSLMDGRILAAMAVVGLAGVLVFAGSVPAYPGTAACNVMAVLLFLATALLHEMSHAAALLRGGYPPGPVGIGVILVWPVLWCDVTAVSLLRRRDRLRVDLAGPAVQLMAAGFLFAVSMLTGSGAFGLAGTAAFAAVVWSLLPFIRADGYWALCDIGGWDELDRPPRSGDTTHTKRALGIYRVLHSLFLLLVAATLIRRLLRAGSPWTWGIPILAAGAVFLVARRHIARAPPAGSR